MRKPSELVGYSRRHRLDASLGDVGSRTVPPRGACSSKVLHESSDRKARVMRSDNSGQAPTDLDRQATEPLAEARVPAFALPSEPRGTVRRRIRGWRSWLLRFLLLIVSPVLTLGLVEAGLRWSGYGYPTTLFLGPEASGAYRSNDQFGWRFFPRPLARRPLPSMLLPKPPETIRVFVLGESAALGIPDPAFGFGRILDVMLREQYPRAQFEVVNVAMTAINSHVVREIADECTSHDADILVVYMGNNEVTGPYGPGTVFQQWARRPPLVQLSIQAKATRVGQLLDGLLAEKLRGDDSPAAWMGMEMCTHNAVPADSQQLALVYDSFRRNLGDICDIARRAGVSVILSTVAVSCTRTPPRSIKPGGRSPRPLFIGASRCDCCRTISTPCTNWPSSWLPPRFDPCVMARKPSRWRNARWRCQAARSPCSWPLWPRPTRNAGNFPTRWKRPKTRSLWPSVRTGRRWQTPCETSSEATASVRRAKNSGRQCPESIAVGSVICRFFRSGSGRHGFDSVAGTRGVNPPAYWRLGRLSTIA